MDAHDLERLTLLERAQQLHDATLRRHGEMLDRHEDARAWHEDLLIQHQHEMVLLRALLEYQGQTQRQLAETSARLEALMQRIMEILRRANGR
jgi:hypothetical protein